ncbi:MAG: STAS-like domain-containing protein [bacterium]
MTRHNTYQLKNIMATCLTNGSFNLVTRQTGKRIREAIEGMLEKEPEGTIIILDFGGIGIIDYSCADEIIAKLITRLNSGEYGDKHILLKGTNSTQRENIEVALERKKLAILSFDENEAYQVLGVLNTYLRDTLSYVLKKGKLSARELADLMGLEINTSSTRLLNLYKLHLVSRNEELLDERGRQFVYEAILPNKDMS